MSLSSLGLLGRKVGMMRLFTDEGDAVPVTVIDVSNNRVTQVKSQDTDGYVALQVTFGSRKASRVTKPAAGHLAKAGVEAGEIIREFRVDADTAGKYAAGATVPVQDLFAAGQLVDVQGTSIGKGFTGTIKRHNFKLAARVARQQPFAQRARLDLDGAGPGPRVPGQEDVGPPGRRDRHHPEPRRRPRGRSPWPADGQGRGPRREERFRDRAPGRQGPAEAGPPRPPPRRGRSKCNSNS